MKQLADHKLLLWYQWKNYTTQIVYGKNLLGMKFYVSRVCQQVVYNRPLHGTAFTTTLFIISLIKLIKIHSL